MKKASKKIQIKYGNILIGFLVVSLVVLVVLITFEVRNVLREITGEEEGEVVTLNEIAGYGYILTENHTEYFTELFFELKELLESDVRGDDFDENYARLVTKMFLADFYDLNSKVTKNDVGGVQFVFVPYQETFIQFATDIGGIYFYLETNLDGERTQKLPIVKEIEIVSVTLGEFLHEDLDPQYAAFIIEARIIYEENLGFDTSRTLVLARNGERIEIVEMR